MTPRFDVTTAEMVRQAVREQRLDLLYVMVPADDGGQTWKNSQPAATIGDVYGLPAVLQFIDPQNGWLLMRYGPCGTGGCDDVVLFATTDGGQTWQRLVRTWEGGLSDCPKTSLAFANSQTGWVSGYCSMALVLLFQRSDNGGRTWQSQTLPYPPDEPSLFEFSQSAGCKHSIQ